MRPLRLVAAALAATLPALAAPVDVPAVSASRFPALEWRLLGPFRGGWSTMAVGVPGAPDTYYFGAAGGGVWKTTDSGRSWASISDSVPITAVGALAVAPSDPEVLYVGTGHPEPRYDVGAGSGVYRSDDGGHSWRSLGLADTRHIGAVLVHPKDANVVLVAAEGHLFGPSAARGVFRSDDGGRHWTRTLAVDDGTGAVDLAADPADPEVVFATTWSARVYPWLSYFTPLEGDGSALWRSLDGGRSWQRLGGAGWPAGPLGRIGIAVTRARGALRLYATVAQHERGGFYRSDDGGAHWRRVSAAGWVTNWYTSRVTVLPTDPDVVYTVGQSIHESVDAGATWKTVRGAPGGDDYHYLWINPADPRRRVAASDQGTMVTVNAGATWSDWYNQPTGQFYYLGSDDRFPYWIYSGQQDSGTVGIASRGNDGQLTLRDWHPVGGDERDYDLPDPEDPNVVFATGLGGRISRWNASTGVVENVAPWPFLGGYGKRPTDFRYHNNWFTPIAWSRQPPYALYAGAQVLFRSLDRGTHWQVVSPDLNGHVAGTADCGGDPSPERALACGYGAINTIAPGPRDNAEIWVGADDGRVTLTRDGGATWRTVTPPAVPAWAKASSIDLSPLAAGTAYVAFDNHRQDDVRPYVFATRDYGATWRAIGAGLPAGHFVSVVRADPVRAGLLYAGTELGAYVSFDDGARWQPLARNLPPVWVHDLLVKGRDLVAATNGRGLWVLDDLAPLRALDLEATRPVLYPPSPAYRLRANANKDTPLAQETPVGRNPPTGAVIDYWLPEAARAPLVLEVRDRAGALVRRLAADDAEPDAGGLYFDPSWRVAGPALSGAAGAHRFVWNLRLPRPPAIEYEYGIAATRAEGTERLPAGALAPPGSYRLTLLVDGRRLEAPLEIRADPRVGASAAAIEEGIAFDRTLAAALERTVRAHARVAWLGREAAARRARLASRPREAPVLAALDALAAALAPLDEGATEAAPGFVLVGTTLAQLATDVEGADRAPTAAQRALAREVGLQLEAGERRLEALGGAELGAANRALRGAGLAPIVLPAQVPAAGGADAGEDLP
jgi:photosystem II stability/assembly factor-like uncharacterized protein